MIKPEKKKRKAVSPDVKLLKELKVQTKLLKGIKEILDNTWRDRRPQ